MRTSAAALELDFIEPSITAAKAVADSIARNGSLQRSTLLWVMEQAHNGSSADGRWCLRDAYDMLELAEVMYLAKADLPADPAACVAVLGDLVANLPTHTVRSEEQVELQQFSTPAPVAYIAVLAARIAPTDRVLEPSAGTGLLAAFAFRAGARLVLNEIDPARAEMLGAAFPGVAVTRHDAELIHDLLAPSIRPTAVLINPPFSRSIGRHADPLAAFRHLRAALMRLGTGARRARRRQEGRCLVLAGVRSSSMKPPCPQAQGRGDTAIEAALDRGIRRNGNAGRGQRQRCPARWLLGVCVPVGSIPSLS